MCTLCTQMYFFRFDSKACPRTDNLCINNSNKITFNMPHKGAYYLPNSVTSKIDLHHKRIQINYFRVNKNRIPSSNIYRIKCLTKFERIQAHK